MKANVVIVCENMHCISSFKQWEHFSEKGVEKIADASLIAGYPTGMPSSCFGYISNGALYGSDGTEKLIMIQFHKNRE